jgi:hypothetical protein
LNSGREANRRRVWIALTDWLGEPDLAGLRERGALEELPVEERGEWLAQWQEVDALRKRTTSP